MTALTTSICIDLLGMDEQHEQNATSLRTRRWVHIGVVATTALCIVLFKVVGNDNVLNAIYVMASYTYGPLLGLYAFGLFSQWQVHDRVIPFICIASPIICGLLDHYAPVWWGYNFGYELLLLNGAITFLGCWAARTRKSTATRG